MKIQVARTQTEDKSITFTIHVSEPHLAPFGDDEYKIMNLLESTMQDLDKISTSENTSRQETLALIHAAQEKLFVRVMKCLKFSISNEFAPRHKHICQEIYNWIYDNQEGKLKKWMEHFDPQRTKYYFDNDKTIESDYSEPL